MEPLNDQWVVRFMSELRGKKGLIDSENGISEIDYSINTLLPTNIFLCESRHANNLQLEDSCIASSSISFSSNSSWRPQSRTKTVHAALALCLNIGVDPPDSTKVSPCARMECWIDPLSMNFEKAMKEIGEALMSQYHALQSNACYKLLRDPTKDDIRKYASRYSRQAKNERVLFHYNGHGVPKPTVNGEIWVFNKAFTQYMPLAIQYLDAWIKTPSIYVFDCSAAGIMVNAFMELYNRNPSSSEKDIILLAACQAHETLPDSANFPADIFSSCLTTPIKMALRWLCMRSLFCDCLGQSFIDKIPGCTTDRRTHLGELNWILTAITYTIAWNVIPRELFRKLFRQDSLVGNLFRNFLLAERILKSANCTPVTYPLLPPTHRHHMWDAWDMVAEIRILSFVQQPEAEFEPSSFFDDQLTAFEMSLNRASQDNKEPEMLPFILWALLSRDHQYRALVLLNRFLDLGSWAVNTALSVGIFPFVLKLTKIKSLDVRQTLITILAKILAFDKSCQVDFVKQEAHSFIIDYLNDSEVFPELQPMLAFMLTIIVNGNKEGKEACLSSNSMQVCLRELQAIDTQNKPLFIQWLCLYLGNLWEDFPAAQLLAFQADASKILAPVLTMAQPEVRASAAFAIGNLLDDASIEIVDGNEMDMVRTLLNVVADGSPLVRFEVAIALARFACVHKECMKSAAVCIKQSNTVICPGQPIRGFRAYESCDGRVDNWQFNTNYNRTVFQQSRFVFSSPPKKGVMYLTESGNSSESSDSEILQDRNSNESVTGSKVLDREICRRCILAFRFLFRDPSPKISNVGKKILELVGIDAVSTNIAWDNGSTEKSLPTSEYERIPRSWLSPELGAGMRRVRYGSRLGSLQDLGLADLILTSDQSISTSEHSLLPHSSIYDWSLRHFSKLLLNSIDDDDDEFSTRREERKKYATDCIMNLRRATGGKPSKEIVSWDTEFKSGVKNALLEPFSPVLIAADETERIRISNYGEDTVLNSFDNNKFSAKGVSKFCLVNELDDSILLVASREGNVHVWKDYAVKGEQKLVTAFSSLCRNQPGNQEMNGIQDVNAVFDWQQSSGYLYATGNITFIMPWDMNKEQCLGSFPSSSDSGISALSASQEHWGKLVAGFEGGSVRIYDIRTPEANVCTNLPHTTKVDRVIGVGFQPGSNSLKIISATHCGNLSFLDTRNSNEPYASLNLKCNSLTSFSMHRHAPMVAVASKFQPTKIFDLNGKHLDSVTYNQSLKPERNGFVSCLAFHPYEVMLACGTTDAIVSVYGE